MKMAAIKANFVNFGCMSGSVRERDDSKMEDRRDRERQGEWISLFLLSLSGVGLYFRDLLGRDANGTIQRNAGTGEQGGKQVTLIALGVG